MIFLLAMAVGILGCGKSDKPTDLPPLFPCTLTFTQEGHPLAEASFALRSTDPAFKWGVGGRTDENGKGIVMTHGKYRGAPTGSYKVTVRKIAILEEKGEKTVEAYVVAPELKDMETTTLEIEIVKGTNEKTFDVGNAVSIVLSGN